MIKKLAKKQKALAKKQEILANREEALVSRVQIGQFVDLPNDLILMVLKQLSLDEIQRLAWACVITHQISALMSQSIPSIFFRFKTERDLRLIRDYFEYEKYLWVREWARKHLKANPLSLQRFFLAKRLTPEDVVHLLTLLGSGKQQKRTISSSWNDSNIADRLNRISNQLDVSDQAAFALNKLKELLPKVANHKVPLALISKVVLRLFDKKAEIHRKAWDILLAMAYRSTHSALDELLAQYCGVFSKNISFIMAASYPEGVLSEFIRQFTHCFSPKHVGILLDLTCQLIQFRISRFDLKAFDCLSRTLQICSLVAALLPSLSASAVNDLYALVRSTYDAYPSVLSIAIYKKLKLRLTAEQKESVLSDLNKLFKDPANHRPSCAEGLMYLAQTEEALAKETVDVLFEMTIELAEHTSDFTTLSTFVICLLPSLTEEDSHRLWQVIRRCAPILDQEVTAIILLYHKRGSKEFLREIVQELLAMIETSISSTSSQRMYIELLHYAMKYCADPGFKIYLNPVPVMMMSPSVCFEGCKMLDVFMPELTEEDIQPFIAPLSKALSHDHKKICTEVIVTINNIMKHTMDTGLQIRWFDELVSLLLIGLEDTTETYLLAPLVVLLYSEDLDASLRTRLLQHTRALTCSATIRPLIDVVIELSSALLSESTPEPECNATGLRVCRYTCH